MKKNSKIYGNLKKKLLFARKMCTEKIQESNPVTKIENLWLNLFADFIKITRI